MDVEDIRSSSVDPDQNKTELPSENAPSKQDDSLDELKPQPSQNSINQDETKLMLQSENKELDSNHSFPSYNNDIKVHDFQFDELGLHKLDNNITEGGLPIHGSEKEVQEELSSLKTIETSEEVLDLPKQEENCEAGNEENQEETTLNELSFDMSNLATFKYRWANCLETKSLDVGFSPSYAPNDPLLLSWDPQHNAFYSPEINIGCGDYHGNIIVDGRKYLVEMYNVRNYTFEVDLFLKDDVMEEPVPKTYTDTKLGSESNKVSSSRILAETLTDAELRERVLFSDKDKTEKENYDKTREISSTKRVSPVGDDNVDNFLEKKNRSRDGDIVQSSIYSKNGTKDMGLEDKMVDYLVEDVLSKTSVVSNSAEQVVGNYLGSRPPSGHIPKTSTIRQPHLEDTIYSRPPSRSSSRLSSSIVLADDSQKDAIQLNGRPSSGHVIPNHGSCQSSRQSVASLTSEQELSRYLESDDSFSYELKSATNTHLDESTTDPVIFRRTERPSSVPAYTSPNLSYKDIRDFAPKSYTLSQDGFERIDAGNIAREKAQSRASSRTITPAREFLQTESGKDSDFNMQHRLGTRESEISELKAKIEDLKDINRSLRDDLEHQKKYQPVGRESDELKHVLAEKEILAVEVVSLREQVDRLLKDGYIPKLEDPGSSQSAIRDYSPTNPAVLKRKIDDLEGHIHDLQEVNETTMTNLTKAEKEIKFLQNENRELKSSKQTSMMGYVSEESRDTNLKVEIRTLQEDVKSLKQRNFYLTEENMRLMEQSTGSSKENVVDGYSRLYSSYRPDEHRYSTTTNPQELKSSIEGTREVKSSYFRHENLAPKDYQKSSGQFGYDTRSSENATKLLHQRRALESSKFQYQREHLDQKNTDIGLVRPNRSRPDGDIDRVPYSDHYNMLNGNFAPKEGNNRLQSKGYKESSNTYALKNRRFEGKDNSAFIDKFSVPLSSKDIYESLQKKRKDHLQTKPGVDIGYVSSTIKGRETYSEDIGDDSDTATDILIATDSYPKGRLEKQAHMSVSDGSDTEEVGNSKSRRSKSMDGRKGEDFTHSKLSRWGSATQPFNSSRSTGSTGHRSVITNPIVTQHNKFTIANSNIANSLNSSLTQGMRPFAPRTPADIRPEDVIKFSRLGGKLTQGLVKYVGHLPGRNDVYLGVELDKDEGKHDGVFEGRRYFKCKPNKGVFVAFNKIVMAWAP